MRINLPPYLLILLIAFTLLSSEACTFQGPAISHETARCGNGRLDEKEECDDGNTTNSDGCSQECKLDPGYTCTGTSCHASKCGDKIRAGSEACDDGNQKDGDGCNHKCQVEAGYICEGSTCRPSGCGDGVKAGNEACDDHNQTSGDGCSSSCEVEPGYVCSGTTCRAAKCGDGIKAGNEECDDHNQTSGDGCNSTCKVESGYRCTNNVCSTICGDGRVAGSEACDDGNKTDRDGCSSCTIDKNWECEINNSGSSECYKPCGTLTKVASSGEECDDGNETDGDGCSSSCKIEEGYNCQQAPNGTYYDLPNTFYFPITYRSYNKDLLKETKCIASEHDNNNPEGSSNILSTSLSNIFGIPVGKAEQCKDRDPESLLLPEASSNPYEFIFTNRSKDKMPSNNSWVSHNYVKATLTDGQYTFTLNFSSFHGAFDPLTIDTEDSKPRLFIQKQYISATFSIDFRFESGMIGKTYAFESDDDIMIYLDGRLLHAEPGGHDPRQFNITLFPHGTTTLAGSDHTLNIFYMNRADVGKLKVTIPSTIIRMPSLCSKCGNNKIEKGEECDSSNVYHQDSNSTSYQCTSMCKLNKPII